MENANKMKRKLQEGQFCLGAGISFNDGAVTEALCQVYDFAWIDTEHNGMTLERVEGHIVATRVTGATALVRVPWNDPVLVKPVLDLGADGIIFPMIRTAEDVRNAVAAARGDTGLRSPPSHQLHSHRRIRLLQESQSIGVDGGPDRDGRSRRKPG